METRERNPDKTVVGAMTTTTMTKTMMTYGGTTKRDSREEETRRTIHEARTDHQMSMRAFKVALDIEVTVAARYLCCGRATCIEAGDGRPSAARHRHRHRHAIVRVSDRARADRMATIRSVVVRSRPGRPRLGRCWECTTTSRALCNTLGQDTSSKTHTRHGKISATPCMAPWRAHSTGRPAGFEFRLLIPRNPMRCRGSRNNSSNNSSNNSREVTFRVA